MLFDAARHAVSERRSWSEDHAHAVIAEIVADAERAFREDEFWPGHPLEMMPNVALKDVYFGAAGVIWALNHLAEAGVVRLTRDYAAPASRLHTMHKSPFPNPTYMLGDAGIALVEVLHARSDSAVERLRAALEASVDKAADLCFGQPGSLVAANFMYRKTGGGDWRALLQRHVDRLWSGWEYSADAQCHLWRLRGMAGMGGVDGPISTHLGACHGAAGNVMALMQAADLLSPGDRDELYRRCVEVYERTALVEGDGVNWRRSFGDPGWGENVLLVQWCYGAPGMVTAMKNFPSRAFPSMDALLLRAGELTWRAGPVIKGPGLCHGTAGNGYAFLGLHERTGQRVWLDRARMFAMDAIEQYRAMKAEHGRGRFSLWTGDLGVALYLLQCVQARAGMPMLDYI